MKNQKQLNIPDEHLDLFRTIGEVADSLDQPVYVVGGYVRDYYLGRLNPNAIADIDLVTVGSGIGLAEKVAKKLDTKNVSIFKRFGTAQVKYKELDLEFVGARKESYRRDSRKPTVDNGTLKDDQLRRDLTINALSWCLNKESF
jgi:tRNA nucleotidyltransferase (CCA-adding enzyme)